MHALQVHVLQCPRGAWGDKGQAVTCRHAFSRPCCLQKSF